MSQPIPLKIIARVAFGTLGVIILIWAGGQIVETNKSGFMHVRQKAIFGDMTCHIEPGIFWQTFGYVHRYKEAETFYFTADDETGEQRDQSLTTRFNDGAQARVSGSLRVVLPRDCESLLAIHRKFHSMEGVMSKLVLPAVRDSLFNTGPHMSAGESYAERRGEFKMLAEGQLEHGIILVSETTEQKTDAVTGETKTITKLTKRPCSEAKNKSEKCVLGYLRARSAFAEFGVRSTNFVVDEITYPKEVLTQIETQRSARMNIITKQAQAKEANARAIKAEAEARAQVAETRATEEVAKTEKIVRAEADKAETILQAEKRRDAAKLDEETAQFEKAANILRGQGESERRRLVMQADGALDKKLKTWLEAQKAYATALSNAQPGALVPTVVMGSSDSSKTRSTATDWMQLMMIKSARDLALDMSPNNQSK